MDKHIEVADGNHDMAKIRASMNKMCDNNGDTFIATLHNVLLAPDLRDRLFSINTLMNLGHTCLYQRQSPLLSHILFILALIPESLDNMDKHIEVADGYNVMKKKGKYE